MKNTQTIRIHRQREDPFARVPKTVSESNDLSLSEKGLICYLCGKPPNWQIYSANVAKVHHETEYTVRKIMNGLRDKGYMALARERTKDKISRWVWLVSDSADYLELDALESLAQEFELAGPERKRLQSLREQGLREGRSATGQLYKTREVGTTLVGNQVIGKCHHSKNDSSVENDVLAVGSPGGDPPSKEKRITTNKTAPKALGGAVAGLRQPNGQIARNPCPGSDPDPEPSEDSKGHAEIFAQVYVDRMKMLGFKTTVSPEVLNQAAVFLDRDRRWRGDEMALVCIWGDNQAMHNRRPKGFDRWFWSRKFARSPNCLFKEAKDYPTVFEAIASEVGYPLDRDQAAVTKLLDIMCQ